MNEEKTGAEKISEKNIRILQFWEMIKNFSVQILMCDHIASLISHSNV
jgi:hypothetical protein